MLHLAPLMRVAVAESALAASPLLAVLRWVTGATALAGAFHGVSGATGLTITQGSTKVTSVTATNGLQAAGFRMAIVSTVHGTAASYTFKSLPAGMTGSLQGVVSGIPTTTGKFTTTVTGWKNAGGKGDNYSTTFSITVLDQAPAVITPPASLSVAAGDPVTLTATVTGTGLTYRWLKDNIELAAPAGTAASYVIAAAKPTDAGRYKLRISNTGGIVVSSDAVLTVTPAGPTIVTPPQSQEVHMGESVTFSVSATSGSTLTYQWARDNQFLANATNATLTIPAATLADAGNYTVAVLSGGTTVTSAVATLKVNPGLGAAVAQVASDGSTTVSVNTIAGRKYIMDEASDLSGTWTQVKTVTANSASTTIISTAAPGGGVVSRFWRVRVIPIGQ